MLAPCQPIYEPLLPVSTHLATPILPPTGYSGDPCWCQGPASPHLPTPGVPLSCLKSSVAAMVEGKQEEASGEVTPVTYRNGK